MVCFVSCFSRGQSLQSSLDLGKQGWPSPQGITREYEGTHSRHMGFDSRGVFYASFAIQGSPKLVHPGQANNIYRVLAIDPEKGTVLRSLDFPTQSKYRVALNINASDQLLVTADDKVALLAPDGSLRNTFTLPVPIGRTAGWKIDESPSGRTLMTTENGQDDFIFLSTDDLSIITECGSLEDGDPTFTFTDTIQVTPGGTYPFHSLNRRPLCGEAQPIGSSGKEWVTPILLADGRLLEFRDSSLTLRRSDGVGSWNKVLPDHYNLDSFENNISLARNSSRFAVLEMEIRGRERSLDIAGKVTSMAIRVYDVETGTVTKSIPLRKGGCEEFVLSQNGEKLAIRCGATIEIWRL
jgi:hypothetical protein